MRPHVRRGTFGKAVDPDLARSVLRELDVGVLVCTSNLGRILLSNPAADRMLEGLRAASPGGPALPPSLERGVEKSLARRGTTGAFPPALELDTRISERRIFVRAKTLPGRAAVLVLITREVLREHELHDVLVKRFRLSHREIQIVDLLREGLSNAEIGRRLALTVASVKQYLYGIFTSLDVHSRARLVAIAERISNRGA